MFIYNTEGSVLSFEHTDFNSMHEYYACLYKYQYGIRIFFNSKHCDTITHIKNILSTHNIHDK